MKKLVVFVLCLLAVFAVSACNNNTEQSEYSNGNVDSSAEMSDFTVSENGYISMDKIEVSVEISYEIEISEEPSDVSDVPGEAVSDVSLGQSEAASNTSSRDDGSKEAENSSAEETSIETGQGSLPTKFFDKDILNKKSYYLVVQTSVEGGAFSVRETAQKGDLGYSSVSEGGLFQWYFSDGYVTFSFDDENKTYEVPYLYPINVNLFSGKKIAKGKASVNGVKANFEKYSVSDKGGIYHYYRESDGSWIGYQYYYDGEATEMNIILELSEELPSHAKFEIPEDYKFYFEDPEVSNFNWD